MSKRLGLAALIPACITVVTACAAVGFLGCSKGAPSISKQDAQGLIGKYLEEKKQNTIRGRFDLYVSNPQDVAKLNWLQSQGYIQWGTKPGLFGYTNLTVKRGPKAAGIVADIQESGSNAFITLNVALLAATVTQVLTNEGRAHAMVSFKAVPLEPIYSMMCTGNDRRLVEGCQDQTGTGQMYLTKYDQGWRVENPYGFDGVHGGK